MYLTKYRIENNIIFINKYGKECSEKNLMWDTEVGHEYRTVVGVSEHGLLYY